MINDIENLKLQIKQSYAEYLPLAKRKVNNKDTYICPLCSHGKGGDGLTIVPNKDETILKCFGCGFYGDIIDLYIAENGGDYINALKNLAKQLNIPYSENTTDTEKDNHLEEAVQKLMGKATKDTLLKDEEEEKPTLLEEEEEEEEETHNFMDYYKKCGLNLEEPTALKFLENRNITVEVAKRFCFGYDADKNIMVMPVTKSYYVTRNADLTATGKDRFNKNPSGVKTDIFNKKALASDTVQYVFVTESILDAVSIMQVTASEPQIQAIALNSTSNTQLFLNTIKDTTKADEKVYILALDNDNAGLKATETLLKNDTVKFIKPKFNLYDTCKDANELLQADKEKLHDNIYKVIDYVKAPFNTYSYFYNGTFLSEVEKNKSAKIRKTGFANVDYNLQSIYNGLYIIGGVSSVGKTTFMHQIADNLAVAGHHVLYFSLEQSRLEMISKSLARQTIYDTNSTSKATNSLAIRQGYIDDNVRKAIANYSSKVYNRLSIIQGNFETNVSTILKYTKQYIKLNNQKPVVFIDYLQILAPENNSKQATKDKVEADLTALKRMSRDLDIPVILISSLNRANYMLPIDFESFKETGGIEYTADVLIGLQLQVISDLKKDNIADNRQRVKEAKAKDTREIELVCLKNRYGRANFTCKLNYIPKYDYFYPDPTELEELKNKS